MRKRVPAPIVNPPADLQSQFRRLADAGLKCREERFANRAKHLHSTKQERKDGRLGNGGLTINWDDESHVRACAFLIRRLNCGRNGIRTALEESQADWGTVVLLKSTSQEYCDAFRFVDDTIRERIRIAALGSVSDAMDGADISNAQGRMATWALERLDETFRPAQETPQAVHESASLGGGIVINLIASACDNPVATGNVIDVSSVSRPNCDGRELVLNPSAPAGQAEDAASVASLTGAEDAQKRE